MKISDDFANILRAERERCNARFAEARHRHADLDAQAFLAWLATAVDPLVTLVAQQAPQAAGRVAAALYDASLELVGAKLAGPAARQRHLERAWQTVLPAALPWLAVDPVRVVHGISNAVHHLSVTPGAGVTDWIEGMARVRPHCGDLDTWLRFGQFLAWRCGLAHFRDSALALADALPERLVLGTLSVHDGRTWDHVRDELRGRRWWLPEAQPAMRLVRRVGGFSGFGEPFRQLPVVFATGERILIKSGEDQWIVECDSYGTTLHRASEGEKEAAREFVPKGLRIEGTTLRLDAHSLHIPDLAAVGQLAATDDTLALCSPDTYAVLLVSLPQGASAWAK